MYHWHIKYAYEDRNYTHGTEWYTSTVCGVYVSTYQVLFLSVADRLKGPRDQMHETKRGPDSTGPNDKWIIPRMVVVVCPKASSPCDLSKWKRKQEGWTTSSQSYLTGGFLKWWYPQIIHVHRIFHFKLSIVWVPQFYVSPCWWIVAYGSLRCRIFRRFFFVTVWHLYIFGDKIGECCIWKLVIHQ